LYLHMEASQHSLLAACFTLHSINATLAIVPQRGAGLWIKLPVSVVLTVQMPQHNVIILHFCFSALLTLVGRHDGLSECLQ
jgi:hypothetical protein